MNSMKYPMGFTLDNDLFFLKNTFLTTRSLYDKIKTSPNWNPQVHGPITVGADLEFKQQEIRDFHNPFEVGMGTYKPGIFMNIKTSPNTPPELLEDIKKFVGEELEAHLERIMTFGNKPVKFGDLPLTKERIETLYAEFIEKSKKIDYNPDLERYWKTKWKW